MLFPWLIGAYLLTGSRQQSTAVNTVAALAETSARVAVVIWVGLLWFAGYILGQFSVLFVANWVGATLFLLANRGRVDTVRTVIVNLSLAGTALLMTTVAIESILRIPRLAATLGTKQERRAWEYRYDGIERNNIFGFRTAYESLEKPPNTFRIVALGDSFTWGDKIPDTEDTWPAQLENELRQSAEPLSLEVVNLGHRGYTTANEAELLQRLGWSYQPDMVIVGYVLNDALPSGPDFERRSMEWLLPYHYLVPDPFRGGAIAQSATLGIIEGRWTALRTSVPASLAYPMLYHPDSTGWRQTREAFREMGQAFDDQSVPGLLVLFPEFVPGVWTLESYPHRQLHATVKQEALASGFLVLDLLPAFAAEGGDWSDWWATPWDRHPNPAAHALAARTVADFLAAEQLLPHRTPEPSSPALD